MKKLLLSALMCVLALGAYAADNLLAGKPVYLLGEAKTWTNENGAYTFSTADLAKVTDPANQENIYLFPETNNGKSFNTEENQAIGIQAFYVDMQVNCTLNSVATNWEGAAAEKYSIYVTNEVPTEAILESDPVATGGKAGVYKDDEVVFETPAEGRYLVIAPIVPTNYGYGVKIRNIQAKGTTDAEMLYFGSGEGSAGALSATVDYAIKWNDDKTLTIEADVEGLDGVEAVNYQMLIAGAYPTFTKDGTHLTLTTTDTYEANTKFNEFAFWFAVPGGLIRIDVPNYIIGAFNLKDTAPSVKLTATAGNLTSTTADITYVLKTRNIAEGTPVKVYLGEQEITENPYTITGLTPSTDYIYTMKAVAEVEGMAVGSPEVAVSFKTIRDNAVATHWYGIADGTINNAYYEDESEAMRRTLPVSIVTEVIYNPDQTITINASVKSAKPIMGMVNPQVVAVSASVKGADGAPDHVAMAGTWQNATFTTSCTYPENDKMEYLTFDVIYNGGSANIGNLSNQYYTGNENAPIAVGEAASLDLSVGRISRVGQSIAVSAVGKDAAGHYVFDTPVELTVDNDNFSVEGFVLTANERGTATLTARSGNLTKTAGLICAMTSEAIKLERANAYASSAMDDISKCFDGNEGTEGVWNCAETEEHWLVFELDGIHDIQGVELIWEGAMAREYTLTLSQQPVINAPAARAQANGAEPSNHVFTVTDGANSADATYRMHSIATGYNAKYITLQTQKAVNAGWGVKLKEMNVYGALEPSGVADVAVDAESAVEYYNLQGVRIEGELAPGLYIRRQGNTASKILVK